MYICSCTALHWAFFSNFHSLSLNLPVESMIVLIKDWTAFWERQEIVVPSKTFVFVFVFFPFFFFTKLRSDTWNKVERGGGGRECVCDRVSEATERGNKKREMERVELWLKSVSIILRFLNFNGYILSRLVSHSFFFFVLFLLLFSKSLNPCLLACLIVSIQFIRRF